MIIKTMKRIMSFMLVVLTVTFSVTMFTGCDFLDKAIELNDLYNANKYLEEQNTALRQELATLKFNINFPTGLVTESCVLNDVVIKRDSVIEDGSVYAIKSDGDGVEITINGGKYDAGSGSLYNISVWAHHNSHIVINGGEFITGDDVNGDANHCVYSAGGSLIEITGGTFYSTGLSDWLLNCQDNTDSDIIVTGGKFINFDPSNCISEGANTSFVPQGYKVISEVVQYNNNSCTLYTVVADDNNDVAGDQN